MKVIGLTGSSGAGKGEVAAIFRRHGIPVIDADAVYHDILSGGGECTEELSAAFGTQILDPRGLVSRRALADTVFGKPNTEALLHTLNEITHKYVMSETKKMLSALKNGGAAVAVIDAPLLFEANAHLECDLTVGVLAARELRLQRVMARDGISAEHAEKRLQAQKPDAFYLDRCDRILENNNDLAALERAVAALLVELGVKLG